MLIMDSRCQTQTNQAQGTSKRYQIGMTVLHNKGSTKLRVVTKAFVRSWIKQNRLTTPLPPQERIHIHIGNI